MGEEEKVEKAMEDNKEEEEAERYMREETEEIEAGKESMTWEMKKEKLGSAEEQGQEAQRDQEINKAEGIFLEVIIPDKKERRKPWNIDNCLYFHIFHVVASLIRLTELATNII